MNVNIKELGYVKNVDIDLNKNLTILCGPNNSGKTYIAYAIYGLIKFRSSLPKSSTLTQEIKNLPDKGQLEIDLWELLLKNNAAYLKQIGESYTAQLPKVFASEKATFSATKITIESGSEEILKNKILSQEIQQEIKISKKLIFRIVKDKGSAKINCFLIENENQDNKYEIPTPILLEFISDRILNLLMDALFPTPYIAPAERIAINIFSKELSLKRNILVDKLLEMKDVEDEEDPFDLIKRRATRYPLPIRDSLETSEDLLNFKKNTSDFSPFADEIESEILKGKIIISKEGEVQYKPDNAQSLKLPIHLSASVVKSLSNLVVYFRHIATKGDFIIIDEPELNLHPDNQVIIARIIAKIANKGFKVLISTHSDYIIRELNNLIMLKDKPEFIDKYNYEANTLLDFKKVNAILFHYKTRECSTLEVTQTGFEVETIDEVINELNERAEDLYFNS